MSHDAELDPGLLRASPSRTQTSFIAGTVVWTESGLRPIDEIRISERAWAKPQDGEVAPACVGAAAPPRTR